MHRTENRPLPAGRLQPVEVPASAPRSASSGVAYLALNVPQPLAAVLAGVTFVSYVVRLHAAESADDAEHAGRRGAGRPAAADRLDRRGRVASTPAPSPCSRSCSLWQVPHFLAIAWIYRDDYARAGLQMLPVVDPDGDITGRQMVAYCLALIPISLLPVAGGTAPIYLYRRGSCCWAWASWVLPSASARRRSAQRPPCPARLADLFARAAGTAAAGPERQLLHSRTVLTTDY